jgi:general secretion pathway protein G
MVIIGMLAALVGPRVFKNVGKGKRSAAKAQIELFGQALDSMRLDTGRYPTSSEGLESLVSNPGIDSWDGPYLKKNIIPKDPWQHEYSYNSPGTHGEYDITSHGLDGAAGGEDENADVNSWE